MDPILRIADRAFRERSVRLEPIIFRLRAAESKGQLTKPLTTLAQSILHMAMNRIFTADHRSAELVLYSFLDRIYASAKARGYASQTEVAASP